MLLTELVAAFQIGRLLSFYFQGESFNARFFFHFNLNTLAEAGGAYLLPISLGVLFLAVVAILGMKLFGSMEVSGNDILQKGFLNRAVCLGDVLTQAGYRQVFLGGASSTFAGKGSFLRSHGYDEVNGKPELAKLLDDPSNMSGWGLYDDSLFDIAANKYAELAAAGQPLSSSIPTYSQTGPQESVMAVPW